MKILCDKVDSGGLYPLSKEDVEKIGEVLPSEIVNVISEIRFAYNRTSTQEGRVVKRGRLYEIRVNFCLTNADGCLRSRMVSDTKRYVDEVKRHGGKPDASAKVIDWDLEHARHYACYVLLHEIGHVIYLERYARGRPVGKAHAKEEKWCDTFAGAWVKRLARMGVPSLTVTNT